MAQHNTFRSRAIVNFRRVACRYGETATFLSGLGIVLRFPRGPSDRRALEKTEISPNARRCRRSVCQNDKRQWQADFNAVVEANDERIIRRSGKIYVCIWKMCFSFERNPNVLNYVKRSLKNFPTKLEMNSIERCVSFYLQFFSIYVAKFCISILGLSVMKENSRNFFFLLLLSDFNFHRWKLF